MMFLPEGERLRVPTFQENYMFAVCFLCLLQIFNFTLKQMLDFMLLQRGNLNSQTETHDMRYIKHILQIEYARVSRKLDFGENFYYEPNCCLLLLFCWEANQSSHSLFHFFFFPLEIRSLNPFWDVFRMKAYIFLSDQSGENFELQVFI